ncbi:hypothetical protein UFOVP118_60 [uncultured Caudovirales phage]|uniref:Uncharacterized protein n=1 Tax=uncultured Caudovirales phage TaxID=2100421 RepID=A0A6J5L7V0_9CAUD|nr:hypothetical protein UFOVP118_60 [uncultured Caudovirales phage]
MAQDQQQSQYNEIYTLGLEPGIKRDGTKFESRECSDGVWCRFQRGVPKKMGGYEQIFSTFNGIPRGMVMNSYNGVNYVFSGNKIGLDVFATGQSFGVGSGPYQGQFLAGYSNFAITSNTSNTFTITSATNLASTFAAGTKVVFAQSTTPTIYTTTNAVFGAGSTEVTISGTITGTVTNVWLANTYFQANDNLLWQFDYQYSITGGVLNLVTHPGLNLSNIDNGIASQVYIGSVIPGANETWTFTGLADTGGSNPTYKPIVVDGGVCSLHPFIFVYGSNGFIANNNVSAIYANQTLTDWNGPLANQVNVATGKIVKGMPVRGGTASPSGLFWATDSLVRVSFVNNGTTYWQYDIVSSEISIMSSNSVVEMDGVYYWMGVDRFYAYNGYVSVLPNDKNVNWLFDNLNYQQRQKVWATKVPRYNEIWFFYPRGSATECTDAIIYNVKDKLWYDAGQAEGAQRSSGFTTEVFPTPIWGDWNYAEYYGKPYATIATPSGQVATSSSVFYVAGDVTTSVLPGSYITLATTASAANYKVSASSYLFDIVGAVTITIASPGVVTYASGSAPPNNTQVKFSTTGTLPTGITAGTTYYVVNSSGATSNISLTSGGAAINTSGSQSGIQSVTILPTGINATKITLVSPLPTTPATATNIYTVSGGYGIWQHETGLNKITPKEEFAIYSSFTTCDLSWVGGTPSNDGSPSINRRLHLRRIEPDFVLGGSLDLTIQGRKFAQSPSVNSGPFNFDANTEKIDLRIEHRELNLTFTSNEIDGNYEMGRILLTVEYGDERP